MKVFKAGFNYLFNTSQWKTRKLYITVTENIKSRFKKKKKL